MKMSKDLIDKILKEIGLESLKEGERKDIKVEEVFSLKNSKTV